MDLLLPLFVAQAEISCQRSHRKSEGEPASSSRFICSPSRHLLSNHCVLGLRPQVRTQFSALACQCACARVFVLFCFLWKENKPKANTACVSTSPRAVEARNSPGQEGFPVGLNVCVQRLPASEGQESRVCRRKWWQWTQRGWLSSGPTPASLLNGHPPHPPISIWAEVEASSEERFT